MNYQILNFWNYKTAIARVTALAPATAHSIHLPTLGDTEIITQVTAWALPYNKLSEISITPRISNDAQNWEKLTALTVGPITSPGTTIFKQDEVGAFQDYEIDIATAGPMPFSYDSGLSFLILALGRGGKVVSASRGVSFEETVKYLDAMRRGENWGAAPGGGRILEFLPRQLIVTSSDEVGSWQTLFTQPIATHEFSELVASVSVDSFIDSSGAKNAQMVVVPWTSIDGIHWVELWADSFTYLTLNSSYPFIEYKKLETIGSFIKFAINFQEGTGLMLSMGAMIEIMGCGSD